MQVPASSSDGPHIGVALITFAAVHFQVERLPPRPNVGPGTISMLYLIVIVSVSHLSRLLDRTAAGAWKPRLCESSGFHAFSSRPARPGTYPAFASFGQFARRMGVRMPAAEPAIYLQD